MFKKIVFLVLSFVFVIILAGCSDNSNTPDNNNVASCEGCHTNYAHLKIVADIDTSSGGSSCGGETPHYDPWDRVYMGGDGFTQFKKSDHYSLGCTKCHNGTDKTADKKVAHSNNFISHPSTMAQEKCAACHADIVSKDKDNIHKGWGQMRKVTIRSGLAGAEEFSKLPMQQQAGYKINCAKCHAGCGECHVNRPLAGGGGLLNGHNFSKKPSMTQTCIICHSSRGGHAFLGVGIGTTPDVHQTKGMDCLSCHKELHGDGTHYKQRYEVASAPKCQDCHSNIAGSNPYHSMHINTFNCQTCHSQNYNNCGSCHIGGDGARIASYMDFKIAMNPLPEVKKGFAFSLVRRTLAASDNWSVYLVPSYSNFTAFPTYNYTTPHNILRWTARTKVAEGGKCSDNCHIRDDGGVMKNKNLYLFKSDLLNWELDATKSITVDGNLPVSWGVK